MRNWLVLSSPVSISRSARSRTGASRRRSSAIDSSTPRAANGWRRRVPSIAADEHVVTGIEKQDPHPVAVGAQGVEHIGQVAEVVRTGAAAPPPPDDQGHTLDLGARQVRSFRPY